MRVRRVVTGHDAQGRAHVVSAGPVAGDEPFIHSPGFSATLLWKTDANALVGGVQVESLSTVVSVLPSAGGTCAMLVTFPPTSDAAYSEAQLQAAGLEMKSRLPGLAEQFEVDAPGFHRTDTIDYGVLIEGELTLLLDDGESCVCKAGDMVVQMGTRHAWRNTGNTPARVMFVMVDAQRC